MSFVLSIKAILILALIGGGGSLGGVAYYYQARVTDLNSQVSNLNSSNTGLNDQIAALKAQIANLTDRISKLQATSYQLNLTSLQLQSVEAELSAATVQLQTIEQNLSVELTKVQTLETTFSTQLSTLNLALAQQQIELTQLQGEISQLQLQLQQASSLCLSGKTLTIGELTDLTDGLATQGKRVEEASSLAINDVNSFLSSSGCSLRFALSVSDYRLDPTVALSELQAFAASGVQVVVGPLNSGTIYNLLSFADSHHIVMISPSSTSAVLAIPNDYLFRTAPNDLWQGKADAAMLKAEGAQKVVILQRHDAYGDSLANATATNFGGSVNYSGCTSSDTVCVIKYDTSQTVFSSTIAVLSSDFNALNATSPNMVGIDAISFEEFSEIVTEINQNGAYSYLLKGHLPLATSEWTGTDGEAQDPIISSSNTAGPIVSSIRLPSTIYGFLNNSKTLRLRLAFASAYPGDICDDYCTGAYDDVWLGALGTLQVGAYNGTMIQAAMLKVADNYYGVTGWTELDSSGDRTAAIYEIWKVTTPPNSSPGWVYAGYWDATTDTFVGFNPY